MRRTASFGWELSNINNNGADTFFQVARPMTLVSIDIDIAFMLVSSPLTSGFAEVLCTGQVSHGAPPSFSQGPQAYNQPPVSTDFGTVHLHNPNDLQGPYNTRLGQDQFLAVILKTWVPANGAASSTERHVTATPGLDLKTGDYIVFHMDHAGEGGDVEMQVVLTYDER